MQTEQLINLEVNISLGCLFVRSLIKSPKISQAEDSIELLQDLENSILNNSQQKLNKTMMNKNNIIILEIPEKKKHTKLE